MVSGDICETLEGLIEENHSDVGMREKCFQTFVGVLGLDTAKTHKETR